MICAIIFNKFKIIDHTKKITNKINLLQNTPALRTRHNNFQLLFNQVTLATRATFRDGVSKGDNRDYPLWLLARIYFAPTLKFL